MTSAAAASPSAGIKFRLSVMMFLQYFVQGSYLSIASVYLKDALHFSGAHVGGFMAAIVYLIYNLLGAGLGGLLVGMLNDHLAPRFGDQAVRYSLLLLPVVLLVAATLYLLGARTVNRDVAAAQRWRKAWACSVQRKRAAGVTRTNIDSSDRLTFSPGARSNNFSVTSPSTGQLPVNGKL